MAKKLTIHVFSERSKSVEKYGLLGLLSNNRPDVEFKEIQMDESGKLWFLLTMSRYALLWHNQLVD